MKKIVKVAISICLCVACVVSVLSFSACKENNLVNYIITVSVNGEDKELNITLDKEVAPKTFEKISKLINDGFYSNAFFYKRTGSYSNQIMFGDLKFDNGEIVQIDKLPGNLTGEFEHGALQGSTYKNVEGSIGLWRTWTSSGYTYSNGNDTGSCTLYMPTSSINDYDGYFCVFGSFDLDDESVKSVWTAIKDAINIIDDDNYIKYTVYYVKDDNNFNFNVIETENFDSVKETAYKAEDNEFQCYNSYEIKVPVVNKASGILDAGVKIKSIKIAE
ncbi:MAG: peptidylprolyl isomerase [Firmicutes bacterium]|nr:peptidylprolyl isomerase [Candidatus Caballimonas caccae]